jgi:hypothetical protein
MPGLLPDHFAALHVLGAFRAVEIVRFEFEALVLGHLIEEIPFLGESVECLFVRHGVLDP